MTFGLLDSGLVPMRQEDVEAAIDAAIDVAPSLGRDADTDAESPLGQIKIIVAAAIAEVWAAAEQANAGLFQASGVQLDNLVQLYRLSRNAAVASTVTLPIVGTPGTIIPVNSQARQTSLNQLWSLTALATIGAGGTVNGIFRATTTGPIRALTGSAFTIATPVAGWTSVGPNTVDAVIGRDVETDGKLRARALSILTASGGTSVDQLRGAILRLTDVTECVVIENDTKDPDADGRPPHSFEAVVRGGVSQTIANTVWVNKPAGIRSATTVPFGTQVNLSVTAANGDTQSLSFSRPELVSVWIVIEYRPAAGFPLTLRSDGRVDGEVRMLEALLDLGADLEIGSGLTVYDIDHALFCEFDGPKSVFSSLNIRLGLSANPPAGSPTVPASRTQLAVLDSSRITITRLA